ncbi:MAG: Zmpste24 [candidate division TA06 bacterium 34_109]|uniref:Zmpste24 n=2 Tax=Bacteria candidate phyla TaxID=1783234 RepID=A0A117M6Y7_UNCT6|nr:MAG: Zmpste24 [candidate division TA06 bacterium 34_109]
MRVIEIIFQINKIILKEFVMKFFILVVILAKNLFVIFLNLKEKNYIKKNSKNLPDIYRDVLDEKKFELSNNYNIEKLNFSNISLIFSKTLLLIFIFSPLFGIFSNFFESLNTYYLIKSLLFFTSLIILSTIFNLPFDFYFHFKIEKKYGFLKYNFKGWVKDKLKELLLNLVLTSIFILVLIGIVGNIFYFSLIKVTIVSSIFIILLIIFIYIFPTVLIPFMYKTEKLKNDELFLKIKEIIERSGYRFFGVYVIKESEKSTHSNAMFTGIGNKKRVILYDNLLNNFSEDEILGVIGHEIGHGKLKHIQKLLIFNMFSVTLFILSSFALLSNNYIYNIFNIPTNSFTGIFLISILFSEIILYFFNPLLNSISRGFEYSADSFSRNLLGNGSPLIKALKKFASSELSNINVDPFYEFFYYSHPTLTKRIKKLALMDQHVS